MRDIYDDMRNKFILTEEEKKVIRNLYRLDEQSTNMTVSGSFTATNCDELHAFQSTSGKVIGNMNVIVANKIKDLNSQGLNVKPYKVTVSVNGMTVNWSVNFIQSDINWVGFTSRGAGCNNNIEYRAGNDSINNGPNSIIDALKKQNKVVGDIEIVDEFTYKGGNNSFKQIFYRYTLIQDKPLITKPTSKSSEKINIRDNSLFGLREKLNSETKDISIDVNSIDFNWNDGDYKVDFNLGDTKIKKMSFLFDNISQQSMNNRFQKAKLENNLKPVSSGDLTEDGEKRWYVLSYLPY